MVSSPERSVIRLRTLGQLDLDGAGERELHGALAQPRRAALLAYLALATPRGHHRRDALLALFWPESDTERARNSLNQAIHFLRLALGSGTIVNRNGDDAVALDWDSFWCDAVAFEDALAAGRTADALDLYRGDLLAGFHVSDAPAFERWLDAERARYASRYAQALDQMAEECEAVGDRAGAVTYWKRLAARDPYNARVALRLMRTLAAVGDAAGAIQHARVHTTLLREELGLAPNVEITVLVEQLQAGHSARSTSPMPLPATVPIASGDQPSSIPQSVHGAAASGVGRVAMRRRRLTLTLGLVVLSAAVAGWAALHTHTPLIQSVAVLPFEDLSADTTHRGFAIGMQDMLITDLARYRELTVISRTSAERMAGAQKSLPEIASDLHADGIVEGTILREGSRIRVTVQLINGLTDHHLWARSYERDLRDVLLLQSELAEAIARELHVAAAPIQRSVRASAGARDSMPDEYYLRELYRRGRSAELDRSPAGIEAAKAAYSLAIERDSSFALGYAGLAGVYGFIADYAIGPAGPALDSARMMARRAVALDSMLPEAHTALAVTLGDAGQFADAEREFRRAIELGPSNANAHYWYAMLLVALGRGADALRESERALSIEPIRPRGMLAIERYAQWLLTGKRSYLKLPVPDRRPVLKLDPGEPWARGREAIDFAEEGNCAAARSSIDQAQRFAPNNIRTLSLLANVYWHCGERTRARALVNAMKMRPEAIDHGYRIAVVYAAFSEKDSAFAWLGHQRWTVAALAALSADSQADSLRADSRFAILTRRLGVRQARARGQNR